jgi:hypothetical protein
MMIQAAAVLAAGGDDAVAAEAADGCVRACAMSSSALKLPLVAVRLASSLPVARQLAVYHLSIRTLASTGDGKLLQKLAASKESAGAVLSMVDAAVAAAVAAHAWEEGAAVVKLAQQSLQGGRMLLLTGVHAATLQLHVARGGGSCACGECGGAVPFFPALGKEPLAALGQALAAAESLRALASLNATKAPSAAAAAEAVGTLVAVVRTLEGLRRALGSLPPAAAASPCTAACAGPSPCTAACADTVSCVARAMRVLASACHDAAQWVASDAAPEAAAAAFARVGEKAAAAAVARVRLQLLVDAGSAPELAAVAEVTQWLPCAELRWAAASLYNVAVELQRCGRGAAAVAVFHSAWQVRRPPLAMSTTGLSTQTAGCHISGMLRK